jgi:hypothetical protein
MSTASAATSALSVSRPSDGGQSMKIVEAAQRRDQRAQTFFAGGERHHLDLCR